MRSKTLHVTLLFFLFAVIGFSLLLYMNRKVLLSSGSYLQRSKEISAVVTEEDLPLLERFPRLQRADFSGSTCYNAILAWAQDHPDVAVSYTVTLPDGQAVPDTADAVDLSALNDEKAREALPLLRHLPSLTLMDLGSGRTGMQPETAALYHEAYPDLIYRYSWTLLGRPVSEKSRSLDLSAVTSADLPDVMTAISLLPDLKTIRLGTDERDDALSWTEVASLIEAVPDVTIDYRFSLYGVPLTLQDEVIDLSYIPVSDDGALVCDALRCMPNVSTLCMDSCGVGNEEMAAIRDAFPDVEVIWRIDFGRTYSARTNVTKILASKPSAGGQLDDRNTDVLKYFTKIKYLDLGHNEAITDISFVSFMPDLEVLIIAMNPLGDLSPLRDCPHLEYLELFYSDVYDLSPLADCKELKHLNIGMCYHLTDISPLYDLDLDRLFIGRVTFIPAEQIAHYRELHPDCEVNDTEWETSTGTWRYKKVEGEELEWYRQQPYFREDRIHMAPRFALLRDQFGYDTLDYSFRWKDPDYRG